MGGPIRSLPKSHCVGKEQDPGFAFGLSPCHDREIGAKASSRQSRGHHRCTDPKVLLRRVSSVSLASAWTDSSLARTVRAVAPPGDKSPPVVGGWVTKSKGRYARRNKTAGATRMRASLESHYGFMTCNNKSFQIKKIYKYLRNLHFIYGKKIKI